VVVELVLRVSVISVLTMGGVLVLTARAWAQG
jgi:hypothetical protein